MWRSLSELEDLVKEISLRLERKAKTIQKIREENVINASESTLQDILKKSRVVVVDFWAKWCAPCHLYEPVFKRVSSKLKDRATFVRVDVDESPKIADTYGITNIPSTLIFVNGEVKETLVGAVDEDTLEGSITKYLNY